LYQRGVEKLNGMMMRDAQPINDAFYRVDQGEGTEADFENVYQLIDEACTKVAHKLSPNP